jgi:hypothetical protein
VGAYGHLPEVSDTLASNSSIHLERWLAQRKQVAAQPLSASAAIEWFHVSSI